MSSTPITKETPMPWWFGGTCEACFECGAQNTRLSPCPKCRRYWYCGKECQAKHWTTSHQKDCPIHAYICKDNELLKKQESLSNKDRMHLLEQSAQAQKIRVAGNDLFSKKDFEGSIVQYEESIALFDTLKKDALEKHGGDSSFETFVSSWTDANRARVYSNMAVCHMEVYNNRHIRIVNKLPRHIRKDIAKNIPHEKLPFYDASHIAGTIKQLGLEEARKDSMEKLMSAKQAAESAVNACNHWWKTHYRMAQVCHLSIEPREAMEHLITAEFWAAQQSKMYDPDKEQAAALHTIQTLREHVEKILGMVDEDFSQEQRERDGTVPCIHGYFRAGYTRLGSDHPRVPFSEMGPEMLAIRLIAAIEGSPTSSRSSQEILEGSRGEAADLLNKILTLMAGPPLELFPADGSQERVPMISVNLLAFYLRTAMSQERLVKMNVESIVRGATEWMTDEDAYCIATHNFFEVEHNHSPLKGHSKTFRQTGGGGCMPCSYRLLRAGCSDWGAGLQSAAHQGKVDCLCFFLNRLLTGAGPSVVKAILETDEMGCNAMMHAANDTFSGFSGLSIRILAHAASFRSSGKDETVSLRNTRKVLNTTDGSGFTPAMAAVSLRNECALAAFVSLRAKLYDPKDSKMSPSVRSINNANVKRILSNQQTEERFRNLVRSIHSSTHDHASCSYCGRPSKTKKDKLFYCAGCQRARYCNGKCQKADHKRHKYICTAKVEKDVAWYGQNMDTLRP